MYWFEMPRLFLNIQNTNFSHFLLFKVPPCLLPPSSLAPWKRRELKKCSYDLAPKIWFFLLAKLGLHVKAECCSFKIERVMALFVHQGEAKSQFPQILKSQNLAQFWDFCQNFCMSSPNVSLNNLSIAIWMGSKFTLSLIS